MSQTGPSANIVYTTPEGWAMIDKQVDGSLQVCVATTNPLAGGKTTYRRERVFPADQLAEAMRWADYLANE